MQDADSTSIDSAWSPLEASRFGPWWLVKDVKMARGLKSLLGLLDPFRIEAIMDLLVLDFSTYCFTIAL